MGRVSYGPFDIGVCSMSLARGETPISPIPLTPGELWTIEVGSRAALRTETMQRDMRWWYGLWK